MQPYLITVIDTPGFDDTEGRHRDELIVKGVKELFDSNIISSLDVIGFVVKHNDVRLKESQRYIFQSVVRLFG